MNPIDFRQNWVRGPRTPNLLVNLTTIAFATIFFCGLDYTFILFQDVLRLVSTHAQRIIFSCLARYCRFKGFTEFGELTIKHYCLMCRIFDPSQLLRLLELSPNNFKELKNGPGRVIRTPDPHVPSVVRYQAALYPDKIGAIRFERTITCPPDMCPKPDWATPR
jgi:hypothetical protein